ncbi:MAG: cytolysin-activating lysine-acyltransferase [Bradyrhizobium sp.]|jgi:cytolysin-activating lysine-acyltransferase|nr:cytolysin-activating lysine-acyltransferase [Bradyrhizobium sp.]
MKKPESTRGRTAPKKQGGGKTAAPSATGEAALQEALAGLAASGGQGAQTSGNGGAASAAGSEPSAAAHPAKTVAQVLGEIAWLMTQSPRHKAMTLGDLEWLVMPAILLRQFRIFYQGDRPVGVAVWALADELVAKRIDAGDTRLTAVEWKSGTLKRIIDIVAPFGGEAEMREQVATA